MTDPREKRRFTLAAMLCFGCLGGAAYFTHGAFRAAADADRINRQVASDISQKIAQQGGADEDIRSAGELKARLEQQYQKIRAGVGFKDLDKYLQPNKLGSDTYITTWGKLHMRLASDCGRSYVKLVSKTKFDNPVLQGDAEQQKRQIEDLTLKLPVVETVVDAAVAAKVEQVLEISTVTASTGHEPENAGRLVEEFSVDFKFEGNMRSFTTLLAGIQQPGRYLMVAKCVIAPVGKARVKNPDVNEDSLIMELTVSALRVMDLQTESSAEPGS